jgi:excisionase family DNA binding protein
MPIDIVQTLSAEEIAAAHRGADHLRSILGRTPTHTGNLTIEIGGNRYPLPMVELASLAKLAKTMANALVDVTGDVEISPQEAAEILRMSRPSVMRLIEKGHLSARMVNTHHRLLRGEVVTYRDNQAGIRRHALSELAALADDYDF